MMNDTILLSDSDYKNAGPQMQWHRKPNAGPCDICGCGPSLRKGVLHRAYTAPEAWRYGCPYVKNVKVCFGTDNDSRPVGWDGKELQPHQLTRRAV
jgi:hypothetical protein